MTALRPVNDASHRHVQVLATNRPRVNCQNPQHNRGLLVHMLRAVSSEQASGRRVISRGFQISGAGAAEPKASDDVPFKVFTACDRRYISRGFNISGAEASRLRDANLRRMLSARKLLLVLDLDHTLLNSCR